MKLVDLTFPADVSAELCKVKLTLSKETVTGMVYDFSHDSMTGSYIFLPTRLTG